MVLVVVVVLVLVELLVLLLDLVAVAGCGLHAYRPRRHLCGHRLAWCALELNI